MVKQYYDAPFSSAEIRSYFRLVAGDPDKSGRYRCPIHGGEDYNLSLDVEKQEWYCHSQCRAGGGIYKMEMALSGKGFKEAKAKVLNTIGRDFPSSTKYYVYTDTKGSPLFRVVRTDAPGERRFHQEGFRDGKYSPGMSGIKLAIYNAQAVAAASTVYFVEGEKCSDALISRGLCATTSPAGAGKWKQEFNQFFQGKDVVIIPDNDKEGLAHCDTVSKSLFGVAKSVKVLRLKTEHEKEDVYDWLVFYNHGIGELEQLAEDTQPMGFYTAKVPQPEVDSSEVPNLFGEHKDTRRLQFEDSGKETPIDVAKRMMGKYFFMSNAGYTWQYNEMRWEDVDEKFMRALALQYDREESTSKRRTEIISYIQDFCFRDKIPWRSLERHEVPFQNGVLDMRTGEMRPHRFNDYLETVIPHVYVPGQQSALWFKVLTDYFGDDEEFLKKVDALQEFFGYCLMQHARYKKALVLYGESDTGKSVVLDMIKRLVGHDNTCSVGVELMDDQVKRTPLIGKLVNSISELTSNSVIADGGFKTLVSTQEPITIEQKYKSPIMYTPIAKHVISTNNLPSVNDKSKATFNRLLLIKFNHPIPVDKQDKAIWENLAAQFPGIVAWAVDGARRLTDNDGVFTAINESVASIEEYRRSQNPMFEFLEDYCEKNDGPDDQVYRIPKREFVQKYSEYTNERCSTNDVSRKLRSIGVPIKQAKSPRGAVTTCVIGYKWR